MTAVALSVPPRAADCATKAARHLNSSHEPDPDRSAQRTRNAGSRFESGHLAKLAALRFFAMCMGRSAAADPPTDVI
jgi:hypothetical protein